MGLKVIGLNSKIMNFKSTELFKNSQRYNELQKLLNNKKTAL